MSGEARPRHRAPRPAERERPTDRPRRIGLCLRDPRHRRQRDSARGQMQKFAAGKFHHNVTPLFRLNKSCAERALRIFGRGRADHSALMPANLTTLAHFSVSAATKLPKSEGEPAITVPPRSASRALSWGSARAALISLLSLLTISAGVPEGPPTPYQPLELVARHELVHRRHVRQSF